MSVRSSLSSCSSIALGTRLARSEFLMKSRFSEAFRLKVLYMYTLSNPHPSDLRIFSHQVCLLAMQEGPCNLSDKPRTRRGDDCNRSPQSRGLTTAVNFTIGSTFIPGGLDAQATKGESRELSGMFFSQRRTNPIPDEENWFRDSISCPR